MYHENLPPRDVGYDVDLCEEREPDPDEWDEAERCAECGYMVDCSEIVRGTRESGYVCYGCAGEEGSS